jgi:hypothetical protein
LHCNMVACSQSSASSSTKTSTTGLRCATPHSTPRCRRDDN